MLIVSLVVVSAGIVVLVLGYASTNRQIRRAGRDPSRGEVAYSWEGGVSKRTSAAMLVAWLLIAIGVVLLVVSFL